MPGSSDALTREQSRAVPPENHIIMHSVQQTVKSSLISQLRMFCVGVVVVATVAPAAGRRRLAADDPPEAPPPRRAAAAAAGQSAMRILPLAIDDWQTGHELPDVVEGRIFGEWIFLRIQNRGESAVSGIQLVVQSSGELSSTTGPSVDLQPGQRTSVYARLAQNSDAEIKGSSCPLRVRLAVQSAGGHVVAEKEHRLLCRSYQDRFSFVYLDADGSPQLAAAKFPAVSPKTNKTACPKQGCAVLLSTHGMDVTAQRQADCYRPKQGAWVLAPHGRGTHGFNWQGPGHWSAIHALRALEQRALAWPRARVQISREPYRLIVTGHSNGGYGAWMFGTHYPDLALGVAPLAGMATIGTTEVQRPLALKDMKLWDLMAGTVEEYRGGNKRAASNLLGTRFIARTGAADRVIHPSMTHKMLTLLEDAGVTWQQKRVKYGQKFEALSIHTNITDTSMVLDKTVVVLKNKEHWWWDTKHTNDGGVMDDAQMRAFWKRCLAKEVDEQRHWPLRFFCANLASCGSPAGVQMLQQRRPGIASSFELRPPNAEAGDGSRWSLRTENCVRLRITPQRRRKWLESSALQIDGQMFDNRTFLDSSHLFCRDIDGNVDESKKADLPKWHACPLDIDQPSCTAVQDVDPAEALCCRAPARRSAERAQGPMRHVLAAPHALVWGTTGAPHTTERYRRAAVAWANAWAAVGGGVASVIADTDYIATRGEHAWTNVIAFGGIESNALSRLLSPEQPFLSLRTPSGSTGETSRIEAGFSVGPCNFTAIGVGLVSLGPLPHAVATNDLGWGKSQGLAVTVAGTSLKGFDRAVELFQDRLFETNSWQHRMPEFVVAGPKYQVQQGHSLDGIVSAGWWGNRWEFRDDSSVNHC